MAGIVSNTISVLSNLILQLSKLVCKSRNVKSQIPVTKIADLPISIQLDINIYQRSIMS